MLGKSLFKPLASAVAIGGMLAAAMVAGPATVTAAPELQTVRCNNPDYVGSVVTSTSLALQRTVARQGYHNKAFVDVVSNTGATPVGRVKVVVKNVSNSNNHVVATRTRGLRNGHATVALPSNLRGGRTYEIRAFYIPRNCSKFKPSSSDPEYYTVQPR